MFSTMVFSSSLSLSKPANRTRSDECNFLEGFRKLGLGFNVPNTGDGGGGGIGMLSAMFWAKLPFPRGILT